MKTLRPVPGIGATRSTGPILGIVAHSLKWNPHIFSGELRDLDLLGDMNEVYTLSSVSVTFVPNKEE